MLENYAEPTCGIGEDIDNPGVEEGKTILSTRFATVKYDDWATRFVMSIGEPVALLEGVASLVEMVEWLLEPVLLELVRLLCQTGRRLNSECILG
jgi:hypothetical protein